MDQLLESFLSCLGNLEQVYLIGTIAESNPVDIIDLIPFGNINREYLNNLIIKSDKLLNKKSRVPVYSPNEFGDELLSNINHLKIYDNRKPYLKLSYSLIILAVLSRKYKWLYS